MTTPYASKVHAPDPRNERWPLCGIFGETMVDDEPSHVTCGHCKRRLGLTMSPKDNLVLAVLRWHEAYVRSDPGGDGREGRLCKAVDEYHRARSENRYNR